MWKQNQNNWLKFHNDRGIILSGEITEDQTKLHHDIQKNATRSVLLTNEGLGLIAVEQAINAAMDVLKETVNGAFDFALL